MLEKEYQEVLADLKKKVGLINFIRGDEFYNESSWKHVATIEYKDSNFNVMKIINRSINDPIYHAIRVSQKKNKFDVQLILIDHIPSLEEFIYIEKQLDGDFRKERI